MAQHTYSPIDEPEDEADEDLGHLFDEPNHEVPNDPRGETLDHVDLEPDEFLPKFRDPGPDEVCLVTGSRALQLDPLHFTYSPPSHNTFNTSFGREFAVTSTAEYEARGEFHVDDTALEVINTSYAYDETVALSYIEDGTEYRCPNWLITHTYTKAAVPGSCRGELELTYIPSDP